MSSALLVLGTDANEARLAGNAALARQAFPVRAAALDGWLAAPVDELHGAALALIDPRTRRTRWLIPTASDGRRSPLRYVNYAGFMRRIRRV